MFYCYLLKSKNERYLNDTYIGFTDNPLHRIRQHNGEIKGGAKQTSRKRPWSLELVVSNFPNKILALMFEWSWQNPFESKFTKDEANNQVFITDKIKSKEKKLFYLSAEFKIKVLKYLINSNFYKEISLKISIFNVKILAKS